MNVLYKVIIVEDEAPIRRSLCKKMEEFSSEYSVNGVYKNGKQALLAIQTDTPDLIITDIRMPVMDGLEFVRKIRESEMNCQIMIISGYSDFDYAREAIKYQVSDYLTKPVEISELTQALTRMKKILDEENPEYNRKAEDIIMNSPGRSLSDLACHYLEEHFTEDISLQDLADILGVGHEHLSRTFKKEKGTSPQHYLIDLKIQEACKLLLRYDELDIRSVGELVGYSDPYYFSRIFKKYVKVSPKNYRNQSLSDDKTF